MSERKDDGDSFFPNTAEQSPSGVFPSPGISLHTHAALKFAVVLIDRTPTDIRGALDNAFLAADMFVAKAREG